MGRLLSIASLRSPYLRAGLGWPERAPVTVELADLNGERLAELLADPVLTVSAVPASGAIVPVSPLLRGCTPWQLQQLIDAGDDLADLEPEDVPVPPVEGGPWEMSDAALIDQIERERDNARFQLDQTEALLADARILIDSRNDAIKTLDAELSRVRAELAEEREANASANDVIQSLQARLSQVLAENADLKTPPPPPSQEDTTAPEKPAAPTKSKAKAAS